MSLQWAAAEMRTEAWNCCGKPSSWSGTALKELSHLASLCLLALPKFNHQRPTVAGKPTDAPGVARGSPGAAWASERLGWASKNARGSTLTISIARRC